MKKIIPFCLIVLLVFSCSKDKFQTKPQLSVKSKSTEVVEANAPLQITLEFTDKEGDVSNILKMYKQRINARVSNPTLRDSITFNLPDFPDSRRGDIQLNLTYQEFLISAQNPPTVPGTGGAQKEADSLRLKFVLLDKAGNASDTLVTPLVVKRS